MPRSEDSVWTNFKNELGPDGKPRFICLYCNAIFATKNATRAKKHLVKDCVQAPTEIKKKYIWTVMQQSYAPKAGISLSETSSPDSEIETNSVTCLSVPLSLSVQSPLVQETEITPSAQQASNSSSKALIPSGSSNSRTLISYFLDSVSSSEQNNITEALSRAIFATASPLSIVDNEFWRDFFKLVRPGWNPTTRHVLSNYLLEREFNKVSSANKILIEASSALVLMSDGWSCISNESHIQFFVCTPVPPKYVNFSTWWKVSGNFTSLKAAAIFPLFVSF